jgi:hypothetical protein
LPIDEEYQKILNTLEKNAQEHGDFKVQRQDANSKTKWLPFTEWKTKFDAGEIDWIPTERQVYKHEIILELDPTPTETPTQLEARADKAEAICNEKKLLFFRYHSGNKSWHFHMPLFADLEAIKDEAKRTRIRKLFCEYFFESVKPYDENLLRESHLIRIPGAENPKSGKPKILFSRNMITEQMEIPLELIAKANKEEISQKKKVESGGELIHPKVEDTNCLPYFTKNKLPTGNRQNVYGKNFMAANDAEDYLDSFVKAQEDQHFTAGNLRDWIKSFDGRDKELQFNCIEVRKTLAEEGMRNVCIGCKYYQQQFGNGIETITNETPYGSFSLRDAVKILELKSFYDFIVTKIKNDAISNSTLYKVYKMSFGSGNDHRYIMAIDDAISYANQKNIYLKILSKDKLELFLNNLPPAEKIMKMLNIGKNGVFKDLEELKELIIKRQSGKNVLLYEIVAGVNEKALLEISNEQGHKIIYDYITMGFDVDEIIVTDFLSDIMIPNPQLIDSNRFMKYNPHGINYTFTTKAGKTHIAERTSIRFDNVTTFALMGGGTGNTQREGELKDSILPIRIDEVQEDPRKDSMGKILSLMELGYANVAQGMKELVTMNSWSSIHFMGNPKGELEEKFKTEMKLNDYAGFDLLNRFENTLQKVSTNYPALGSRFGFIIFLDNIQPVSGKMVSINTEKTLYALMDTIRKTTSDTYTKLYLDDEIVTWLEQEYSSDYITKVKQAREVTKLASIREFLREYGKSYRHLRGKALKIACTYFVADLMSGKIDKKKLLLEADKVMQLLQNICINSIFHLASVSSKTDASSIIKVRFEKFPLHLKALILASVMVGVKTQKNRLSSLEVEEQFITVLAKLGGTMGSKNAFLRILSSLENYNSKLQMMDISLVKIAEDELAIFINDLDLMAKVCDYDTEVLEKEYEQMRGEQENDVQSVPLP